MSCKNVTNHINNHQQLTPLIDNQLMSVENLAQYLGVPTATVRQWVYQRKIPFMKIGRHVRFRNDPDIQEWLKERTRDVNQIY